MKKTALLGYILIASISYSTLTAQSTKNLVLTVDIPQNHHFSPERLHRIDAIITQYIDSNWIAGAIALVAKDGTIIYNKSFVYNGKKDQSLQKDAIFRIAAQTKAITSAAVMMLYEEGKILLDDPISKYIPEFKNPKVIDKYNEVDTSYTILPAKREITIRDLLSHTSGIAYAQIDSLIMNAIYFKGV